MGDDSFAHVGELRPAALGIELGSNRLLSAVDSADRCRSPGSNDCPEGLLGAFHEGRQALLMCGNNLPDDPASIWVVLAHESAHVMQFCKGGPLMPAAVLGAGMDQARRTDSQAFRELKLYNSSQHHVEAEARLVQALPPDQVRHLFEKHCAERLKP